MNFKKSNVRTFAQKLLRDEEAATAIEYGLIAALLGVSLIVAMQSLGNSLSNTYNTVNGKMATANSTAAG